MGDNESHIHMVLDTMIILILHAQNREIALQNYLPNKENKLFTWYTVRSVLTICRSQSKPYLHVVTGLINTHHTHTRRPTRTHPITPHSHVSVTQTHNIRALPLNIPPATSKYKHIIRLRIKQQHKWCTSVILPFSGIPNQCKML